MLRNKILFFDSIDDYGSLPTHVSEACSILLDFDLTVAKTLCLDDDQFDDVNLISAFLRSLDLGISKDKRDSIMQSIKRYQHISRLASSNNDGNRNWEDFYERHFLQRLTEKVQVEDTDTRRYVP